MRPQTILMPVTRRLSSQLPTDQTSATQCRCHRRRQHTLTRWIRSRFGPIPRSCHWQSIRRRSFQLRQAHNHHQESLQCRLPDHRFRQPRRRCRHSGAPVCCRWQCSQHRQCRSSPGRRQYGQRQSCRQLSHHFAAAASRWNRQWMRQSHTEPPRCCQMHQLQLSIHLFHRYNCHHH